MRKLAVVLLLLLAAGVVFAQTWQPVPDDSRISSAFNRPTERDVVLALAHDIAYLKAQTDKSSNAALLDSVQVPSKGSKVLAQPNVQYIVLVSPNALASEHAGVITPSTGSWKFDQFMGFGGCEIDLSGQKLTSSCEYPVTAYIIYK